MAEDSYKHIAGFYDTFVAPFTHALRKQYMLKTYPPEKGMHVLEVGCGTGLNLRLYQKKECKVYGIDTSGSMVKAAVRKLGEQAEIHLGDASDMKYSDNSFDLVIAMLTLHEMQESVRQKVMGEMVRVMKTRGRLLLVDFHSGSICFPQGYLYKAIIPFFEISAGKEHFRNYRNFLAKGGLPPLIERNNLHIEKSKILGGGNLSLFTATKINPASPKFC